MSSPTTLLLTRRDVSALLTLEDCIAGVERAFRLYGEGRTEPPGLLGVQVPEGGFHIKAGVLDLGRRYFAAKTNANFPDNPKRNGLPTIQGVIVLCDAESGCPLALMDSIEITILRTGAATAVATKYLAGPEPAVVAICGCGVQGRAQLRAIATVRRLERVYAFDVEPGMAEGFAAEMARELGVEVRASLDLRAAMRASRICVTCTPSRRPILGPGDVVPGTFVAAVGADNPVKQELAPALMTGNKIVVDLLDQAASIGDLHHALADGAVRREDVYAELGEIVAGRKPGRTSPDEIIIFDSTGMALQDVAAAAVAYERAVALGAGQAITLND